VRTLRRVAKVPRRTLGFRSNRHRSHLVRRTAAKRTRLRCQVSASVCANSACSSGLNSELLSEFAPKRFQGLGRKITGLFLFRPPPETPAASTENTGRRTGPAKPRAPKHPAGPKATLAPPRGGPGVPRKRCYWPIFSPLHRQHPGGSLRGHGGHRGAVPASPDPKSPPPGASNHD
jgi:hypothetical protein